MRVLILDDNAEIARCLADVLKAAGFETRCLDSFDAALNEILTGAAAAVFSEIFVGKSDVGIFLNKIKSFEDAKKSRTPVVVVSPVPMAKFFDLFPTLEVFGYIERPFSSAEVVNVARKASFFIENFLPVSK